MKCEINHSGSVNRDPRFAFSMVDIGHASITVGCDGISTLRFEAKEGELRDLIFRAQVALEQCRLRDLFDRGKLSFDGYKDAMRDLEMKGPPQNESEET